MQAQKQPESLPLAGTLRPLLVGIGLALLTMVVIVLLPRPMAREGLALLLALLAGLYIGAAMTNLETRYSGLELAVVSSFFVLALLGLHVQPFWLAIGYFAHGLWDTAHHPSTLYRNVPGWYAPFCLSYDWLIALFILGWFGF